MFEGLGFMIKPQIGIAQCYNSCWKSLVLVRFPVTSRKQFKRYNAFVSKFHWLFLLFILDDATILAFNAGNFILIDHIDGPECYVSQCVARSPIVSLPTQGCRYFSHTACVMKIFKPIIHTNLHIDMTKTLVKS